MCGVCVVCVCVGEGGGGEGQEAAVEFKPFAHDEAKQRRYELFLEDRDSGRVMSECRARGYHHNPYIPTYR